MGFYDMKMHECCNANMLECMRVPGGWLYMRYDYEHDSPLDAGTFVPFDNEFMQASPPPGLAGSATKPLLGEVGTEQQLPWSCPDHPHAQIRREWDRTQYVYGDGYPRGGFDHNYHFFCNDCGRELAPDKK